MADFPERLSALQPFWGSWYLDERLGEGGFGKVYRIYREEFGVRYYAALKWLYLPVDQNELIALRGTGLDENGIRRHYEDRVKELQSEIQLMSSLRGFGHIVSFEDHAFIPRRNEIGWDILIRMELLTPLPARLTAGMTVGDVVRMGIQMCDALEVCAKKHIVHRDIKPDNIFVNSVGDFKLGDFGVARTMRGDVTAMSMKGTPVYMAPEVYNGQSGDVSVDQYSLGLVMHRLLNAHQVPFAQTYERILTHDERAEAFAQRLKGTPVPPPLQGSPRLKEIICKACSFQAKKRYPSPEAMRKELEAVLGDRECSEPLLALGSAKINSLRSTLDGKKKKSSLPMVIVGTCIVALVALLVVVLALALTPPKPDDDEMTDTPVPVTDAPATTVLATDTPAPTATATPAPTETPPPTPTLEPTETQTPTATPTAMPTPTPDTSTIVEQADAAYEVMDYDGAFELYLQAAELGDIHSQLKLEIMYENGYGVDAAIAHRDEWQEGANNNDANAQYHLGNLNYYGYGVEENYGTAVFLFRRAAAQGHSMAQNNLGCLYVNGEGVDQDLELAWQWFDLSVEQGNPNAMMNMGQLYEYGIGVPQDTAQAAEWYLRSAELGYENAQFRIGYFYEQGIGVEVNLDTAIDWYSKAAAQGDTDAQMALERLMNATPAMTDEPQRVEASVVMFPENVMVMVNGTAVTREDVEGNRESLINYFSQQGYDMTDESNLKVVDEYALDAAVENAILDQKIAELGLELTDEERAEVEEQNHAEWAEAVDFYAQYYYGLTEESTVEEAAAARQNAEALLESMGYTESVMLESAMENRRFEKIYAYMVEDATVTDEDIRAAFDAHVAEDQASYENDIFSYEFMTQYYGNTSYYTPVGYRGVTHILLGVEQTLLDNWLSLSEQLEESENGTSVTQEQADAAYAAILASVQPTIDEIYAKLAEGVPFADLVAEYGTDPGMTVEPTKTDGYPVHKDSIMWDPAFVAGAFSVDEVGAVSEPVVGSYGVHIIQYTRDIPAGPVELTEELKATILDEVMSDKESELYRQTLDTWLDEAEIVYSEEAQAMRVSQQGTIE